MILYDKNLFERKFQLNLKLMKTKGIPASRRARVADAQRHRMGRSGAELYARAMTGTSAGARLWTCWARNLAGAVLGVRGQRRRPEL